MIGYIISAGLLLSQGGMIMDLWADSSVTAYVGPDHSLSSSDYVPDVLVTIPTSTSIIPTKTMKLRLDAMLSLQRMSVDMYDDLGLPLIVISAYRSASYQRSLIRQLGDGNLRAKPGHSEHQLGLAIDVMGLSNAHMEGQDDASLVYQRLVDHAHRYGRHQSYQKGLAVDGYYQEKRHRRYLGTGLATYLHRHAITLTEYFYQAIQKVDQTGTVVPHTPHVFSSRITTPPPRTHRTPQPYRQPQPTQTPAPQPAVDPYLMEQLSNQPL